MAKGYEYMLRKLWEIKGCPKILKDTISAALAVTCADKVSDVRVTQRLEICGACRHVVVTPDNQLACGVCGCTISDKHLLLNLALYEEDSNDPPLWGCKAPVVGSKWKAASV